MIIHRLDSITHQAAFEDFTKCLLQNSFMNWTKVQLLECLTLYQVWALEEKGQIKSALCVRPLDQNWEVLWVQTRPESLENGFAFQLIRYWLDNASHSSGEVWLEVHEANTAALRLYEKLEFSKQSFRKNYYPDGAGAHVLKVRLGSQKRLS
jgi:ribosomal-protein-alanine N-acetyltransferase